MENDNPTENSDIGRARELQREAAALELRELYPTGTFVRVPKQEVDRYQTSKANKLRDRVGIIKGHQVFSGNPIVAFPAYGRRKEFQDAFSYPKTTLELLTDETEIAQWRQTFKITA